ncbi:Na+/H+ antiporter [Streptomyces mirabilis]|uniref:Sodium/proton antiporter, CPA1 family (TC 2.A.36) n=1 Tax=Streptomyces mirabilis TaxID=68239 RepID=A0A1I2K5R9_9ACTN|nr:Na+/H+ antiporter [Streptomyces mirabilis]SFF62254.1 sodium/proton antiporter, CPA1 family (TC 2.A.36) [Streptomyces mirabilis]
MNTNGTDVESLELIVVVAVGVLAMGRLSRRTGLSEPLLLLGAGCLVGLTPPFAGFALSPDVVLFLFLPALLYWEALTSSVREIRNNVRSIALQATGLVPATAVAVAAVAHALGYSWPIAFVLGAVLAPTDAAAVAAVAKAMPRRILTVLRAESLLNDGTALVLLAVAIEVVTDERPFSWSGTALAFVESYAGGIVIGAAIALLLIPVRRRLPEPLLHSVLSVATPFLAYLPAELLHVSGVLAVVTCGLVTTRFGPRVIGSDARVQAIAFWEVASYLLNGALFILVGIQLPAAVRALTSVSLAQAVIAACAVSVAVIGTRLLWFYSVPYLVRFLDRRPRQRGRRITAPQRLPLAWAGMRGAISLAAALTVPAVTAEGHVVEQRDAVVFITAVVIVVTLAFLGPTLPTVVRRARFPEDEVKTAELTLARCHMSSAALRALPELAQRFGVPEAATLRMAQDIEDRRAPAPDSTRRRESVRRLELALLQVKRDTLRDLRDAGSIDDIVLRAVQEVLDVEEVRLGMKAHHPAAESSQDDPARS